MKSRFMSVCGSSAVLLTTIALASIAVNSARAQDFYYSVSVPTDSLNANSGDGPFGVLFTLTSATGDGTNTIDFSNFNVAGPPSSFSLTDNDTSVYAIQDFTPNGSPGSTLDFTLSTTNNTDLDETPDELAFYIYQEPDGPDPTPVPTTDPGSSLFYIDLGGASPTVTTFLGTDPYEGLNPTVTPEAAPTPEPSTTPTLFIAFAGLAGLVAFRKRAKAVVR